VALFFQTPVAKWMCIFRFFRFLTVWIYNELYWLRLCLFQFCCWHGA